jgi:hypothetical protein
MENSVLTDGARLLHFAARLLMAYKTMLPPAGLLGEVIRRPGRLVTVRKNNLTK